MEKKIEQILLKSEIKPTKQIADNFIKYYNLLIEGNKICNLTAITDEDGVVEKHFYDSIFPQKYFSLNAKVLDIGAGAGFPSIPLKLVRDDLSFTLLDSLNKRINFLNNTIQTLNLKNIAAMHGRAEDFAKLSDYREKFDITTARAVANLKVLSEYCLPFVKVGGQFIAYKSGNCEEEINEAKQIICELGGKISKVIDYNIVENSRKLVIIEKIKETPKKYPRPTKQIKNSKQGAKI